MKNIFKYLSPTHLMITNITRDQPPRHGHVDLVFDKINDALKKNMHLVINGDDPYLRKFNLFIILCLHINETQ